MGKCNPVLPGKCNLKHTCSLGGQILESHNSRHNSERDLRVKLDMNLQCDMAVRLVSTIVLIYRGIS